MIVSLEQGQIQVSMRLIPGVAVSSAAIAAIDSNGDGVFSEAEQQTYAREVLGDLSLSVDGHALSRGYVPTTVAVALCHGTSTVRRHAEHVPPRHAAHRRRYGSSSVPDSTPVTCTAACRQVSWAATGGIRHSLVQIVRVVTAFTIGLSAALALGASGLVSLPSRAVEVLIAFSILVSAVHALRPLFPGREPAIAAGFGLVHGLAFATTLQNLGVGPWQRVASIMGFNLGIETMQLIVVGAILPSLIILSRTPVRCS